jgi:lysyl-tRNA synthetase class 2
MSTNDDQLRQERLRRLERLREQGINPYASGYSRTHLAAELQQLYRELPASSETQDVVRVCGRIMNERNTWMFVDLFDESGRIQLFCPRDRLAPESLRQLRLLSRGDIVGAEGTIRRTRQGDLSVSVTSFQVLSASLNTLPGLWHGFSDHESRYRQRSLDMIMNRQVMDVFRRRSLTVRSIRQFLDSRGFLEMETPALLSEAGGAEARPFVTHHNALGIPMFLRIATELHLKRLIVGGFERIYEIGRIFRNEGMSTRHNPEFTTLEMYQAYGDYLQLMDLAEEMILDATQRVTGSAVVSYQGVELNFNRPWRRVTMDDAIRQVTGADVSAVTDLAQARQVAESLGVRLTDEASRGAVINAIFEQRVEETLIQPTFIMDYPVEVSPLARAHRSRPGLVERFELFVWGRELANGYSELIDPVDQRQRLEAQAAARAAGNDQAQPLDLDFIEALEYGMPPTMGLGVGIDRMVMLLTDSASIRDVIAFPIMRPLPRP